jgi:glutathione S-transferase
MRTLYHFPLSPYSRKVRVALKEKALEFELAVEKVWERRDAFLALNPAGQVPVLVEADGAAIVDSQAIAEYLDEAYPERGLLGADPAERAEARRLVAWFDQKFGREVTENLVGEKLMKRVMRSGQPNTSAIRAGQHNLHYHLAYIAYLTERRTWLAGDNFGLADIAAGAHISCLDYIGDVPWGEHPQTKDWYARIKSRPSFRPLLADHIPGFPPPKHYADLDF